MTTLTSIDYSELICYIGYAKYRKLFNKTQINKLLYICYGFYLAKTGQVLFKDDTPKAWPFGPVFPRVNKRFISDRIPVSFSLEKQCEFKKDQLAIQIVEQVVDRYHNTTAKTLSDWSHEEGGPWSLTVYGENLNQSPQWGKQIKDQDISEYFKGFLIG